MRILIAHSFYRAVGGEDRYVLGEVELLRDHHHVALLARRNHDLKGGALTAARMAWSPGAVRDVEQELERFRPQLIHLHNAYPALGPAAHLAATRHAVPLVMTVHNLRLRCPNGLQFTRGVPCRRCEHGLYANAVTRNCFPSRAQAVAYAGSLWLHRFALRLEERVSLFVAPSGFVRDRLLEWGFAMDRVKVVRNFVDVRSDAVPDLGTYGLFLGRLSTEKGLHDLLHALWLADDPPFCIAGAGPLDEGLRRLAARLKLARTNFLGHVGSKAALKELLRHARYLVIPSRCDENAPLAALEAMAEGRPLLVTRAGGLPELVDGGAGLICKPGDVEDMAVKLQLLNDDPELCQSAGTNGLKFAMEELRPDVHRRRLEAVFGMAIA